MISERRIQNADRLSREDLRCAICILQSFVPHLRLQLLEEVLDHDQLAPLITITSTSTQNPNHEHPLIVWSDIVALVIDAVLTTNGCGQCAKRRPTGGAPSFPPHAS